jgi:signal peptidase II
VGAMLDDAKPARRLSALKIVAVAIVLVGVVADLATKSWMQQRLGMNPDHPHESQQIEVIPGFLRWQGNWNEGITFGIFQGHTEPILLFTVLACIGIFLAVLLTRSRSRLLHVALAMILGGAIGNLYDRWQWHKVRDFVLVYWKDPSVWNWPAFNVADSLIVVGVILILWRELFGRRPVPVPAPQAQETSA